MKATPEQLKRRELAFRLRLKGWSYARIAKELGVSQQRIQALTTAPIQIRQIVKQRADYHCQQCGLSLPMGGHIHHKGCDFETPNDYNDLENLQYLCASCHTMAHSSRNHAGKIRTPRYRKLNLTDDASCAYDANMTATDVIKMLKEDQGSMSGPKYAKLLGVSNGYLADVYRGRRDPGPAILRVLGLQRVVVVSYEPRES